MADVGMWRERLLGAEGPAWTPMEAAFVAALLARPNTALDFWTLCDALWTARSLEIPESAEGTIKDYARRVRVKLAAHKFNAAALVNVPPRAYALNLDVLPTPPVHVPRYWLVLTS